MSMHLVSKALFPHGQGTCCDDDYETLYGVEVRHALKGSGVIEVAKRHDTLANACSGQYAVVIVGYQKTRASRTL